MKFPSPSSLYRTEGPACLRSSSDFRPTATGSRINSKLSDKKTDYLLYVSNKDIADGIKTENGKFFKRFYIYYLSSRFFGSINSFLPFSFLLLGREERESINFNSFEF